MSPHCETTPFTAAGASAATASVPPTLDNLPIGSCSNWSNFQTLVIVGWWLQGRAEECIMHIMYYTYYILHIIIHNYKYYIKILKILKNTKNIHKYYINYVLCIMYYGAVLNIFRLGGIWVVASLFIANGLKTYCGIH